MEIKRVECPKCHTVYDIENKNGEQERIFSCKQCKQWLRVRFSATTRKKEEPIDAIPVTEQGETQYAGRQFAQNKKDTVYVKKSAKKGVLVVGGNSYELLEGINTVGRKSPNSTASVQLDVKDDYMSRNHVKISCVNCGKPSFKAIISNDKNKNETLINGTILEKGEEIVLTNGCNIKMGNTIVIYQELKQ